MRRAVSTCPVCRNPLTITRLTCGKCNTSIEGEFANGLFSNLNDEERDFVELFVVCRGNIKEMEKRLGVSYPTIRNRLDSVVRKLEQTIGHTDPDARQKRRLEILDSIRRGDITAEEGAALIEEI